MTTAACWLCEFLLVFCMLAARSEAVWCYNATRKPLPFDGSTTELMTHRHCDTASCAEILAPSALGKGNYFDYQSGCGDICKEPLPQDAQCKLCSSDFCNRATKADIVANAHYCQTGKEQPFLHEQTVTLYCNNKIAKCYYRLAPSLDRLIAGCYAPGQDPQCDASIGRDCAVCDTKRCNEPPKDVLAAMQDQLLRNWKMANWKNVTTTSQPPAVAGTEEPAVTTTEPELVFEFSDYVDSALVNAARSLTVASLAAAVCLLVSLLR